MAELGIAGDFEEREVGSQPDLLSGQQWESCASI